MPSKQFRELETKEKIASVFLFFILPALVGCALRSSGALNRFPRSQVAVGQSLTKLRQEFGPKVNEFAGIIDISKQNLFIVRIEEIAKSYPVSTSKYGTGSQEGSNKTPLGAHCIYNKTGNGARIGTVFESGISTNKIAQIHVGRTDHDEDLVTTQMLWLMGLESGGNKGRSIDLRERHTYTHGTPEEGLIGALASHGCIRMKNDDMIELSDLVPEGTPIEIQK